MNKPDSEERSHSAEEKFFGMSTVIDTDDESAEDPELEIEASEEEAEPAAKPKKPEFKAKSGPAAQDDEDELDEEMADYGERVQKRIKKLTWEKNEERRQREQMAKEREEALKFGRQVLERNAQYEDLIHNGEATLIANMRAAVNAKLVHFEQLYRTAYEEGDTDTIINAQKEYFRAEAEQGQLNMYEQDYQNRAQNYQQYQRQRQQVLRQPPPPPPTVLPPDHEAIGWAERNPWFNKDKAMTSLAYGLHEALTKEQGYVANTPEYYAEIDRQMRLRFPDYFEEHDDGYSQGSVAPASTHRKPKTVVAPGQRNNGQRPRKVKLTQTQLAVAKQLGLTPEQYAKQALIDQGHVNG